MATEYRIEERVVLGGPNQGRTQFWIVQGAVVIAGPFPYYDDAARRLRVILARGAR